MSQITSVGFIDLTTGGVSVVLQQSQCASLGTFTFMLQQLNGVGFTTITPTVLSLSCATPFVGYTTYNFSQFSPSSIIAGQYTLTVTYTPNTGGLPSTFSRTITIGPVIPIIQPIFYDPCCQTIQPQPVPCCPVQIPTYCRRSCC